MEVECFFNWKSLKRNAIMLVVNKMLCAMLVAVMIMGCNQSASNLSLNNQNQSENPLSVKLENSFPLRVNQIAQIESEKLELKLLDVKSDSRCPSGTQCIWAGLVEIVIEVARHKHDAELILIDKQGDADSASQTFDGYLIKLIEVAPYPQKNQTIEIEDYTATLVVFRE